MEATTKTTTWHWPSSCRSASAKRLRKHACQSFQRASEQSISTTSTYGSGLVLTGIKARNQADESKQSLGWMWFGRWVTALCSWERVVHHSLHHEQYSEKWKSHVLGAKRCSKCYQKRNNPKSQQIFGPSQTSASCTKFLHIWFLDALKHRWNAVSLRNNMGSEATVGLKSIYWLPIWWLTKHC